MKRTGEIGIAYAAIALFFNVGMDVFAKMAAVDATTSQIVFFRWFFGLILLSIPFFFLSSASPKSPFKMIHGIRLCLNLIASFCLYHALGTLPLSIVLTVFFLEPVIAIFTASIILREQVSALRWLAGAAGLVGVVIIAKPDIGPDFAAGSGLSAFLNFDVLIAVLGATSWAVMRVLTKKFGAGVSVITLSFWLALFTTLASAPMALASWQPITPDIYLLLFAVAGFGAVYNYLWLKALMIMPVARLANLSYVALPFSFVVGFLLFGEVPNVNFYIGSTIIFCVVVVTANKSIEKAILDIIKSIFRPTTGIR